MSPISLKIIVRKQIKSADDIFRSFHSNSMTQAIPLCCLIKLLLTHSQISTLQPVEVEHFTVHVITYFS